MRTIPIVLGVALLLVSSPAVAQEWETMVDRAREALEETHADLQGAMEHLAGVDEAELREMSERIIAELGERMEIVHHWTMELAEQLAQTQREAMELREREEAARHDAQPERPAMLGRTLRLTFAVPGGPVSILTATPDFEASATRHEHESNNVEADRQGEQGGEKAFEVRGEIEPLEDMGRFLIRFDGHARQEERGEEIVHHGGEANERVHGGDARFRGSVIIGVGESKPILTSPSLEVHLALEEG